MNGDILELVVRGEATESTFENVLNDINAIIQETRATKAIADFCGVSRRIDSSDWYRYLRNYRHALLEIEYAIVDLPQNDQCKFALKQAGLKSLVWFTDMDTARKWMQSNKTGRDYIYTS